MNQNPLKGEYMAVPFVNDEGVPGVATFFIDSGTPKDYGFVNVRGFVMAAHVDHVDQLLRFDFVKPSTKKRFLRQKAMFARLSKVAAKFGEKSIEGFRAKLHDKEYRKANGITTVREGGNITHINIRGTRYKI